MGAVELLAYGHGQALRMLAAASSHHCTGLAQAARHSKLDNSLKRKLVKLDVAFAYIRHVTEPGMSDFLRTLSLALDSASQPAEFDISSVDRTGDATDHSGSSYMTADVETQGVTDFYIGEQFADVAVQTDLSLDKVALVTPTEYERLRTEWAPARGRPLARSPRTRRSPAPRARATLRSASGPADSDKYGEDFVEERNDSKGFVSFDAAGCDAENTHIERLERLEAPLDERLEALLRDSRAGAAGARELLQRVRARDARPIFFWAGGLGALGSDRSPLDQR